MAVLASGFAYVHFDGLCTYACNTITHSECDGNKCDCTEQYRASQDECNTSMICCFDVSGDSRDKSAIQPVPPAKTVLSVSFSTAGDILKEIFLPVDLSNFTFTSSIPIFLKNNSFLN